MNDNLPKNVTYFTGYTSKDVPPDRVLINNIGQFEKVFLVGYDHDGQLRVCSSQSSYEGMALDNFMLDQAKAFLLKLTETDD